jgi:hypothetical protein
MTGRALALVALIVSFAIPAAARADVTPVSSGSTTGTGTTTFSFTVPASNDRFLVVGISTTANVTVSSVTFGPQVLAREQQATSGAVRSETWRLIGPNVGTANVTVTLSGSAPVIAGAVAFAGVDQFTPVIVSSLGGVDNTSANAASFIVGGTVQKDGMFGTLTISPADQTGAITTQGSTDTVVADNRWSTAQGTIRGAGSTRVGWTGQNMSQNSGIAWLWPRVGGIIPFAYTWLAMKATTGNTPPAVSAPTATNVMSTGATLGGTMTSTGGVTVTRRGVVYCRCADPVLGGSGVTALDGAVNDTTGPFTVNATNLLASTQYTYKAFAANGLGTSYTATAQFTTAAPPNQAPTANVGGPYGATEGFTPTLSGSATDPEGDPLTFSWDLNGDGTYGDATGATPTITLAQMAALGIDDGPSAHTVHLRVSDGTNTTTSAATTWTMVNAPPNAGVDNVSVPEGTQGQVSFFSPLDPSTADTAAGIRFAYDINNDGTYEIGGPTYATATTSLSAAIPAGMTTDGGTSFTVRMAAIDKDNGIHVYTPTVFVSNVAPTAALANQTVDEGATVSVGVTGLDDVAADRPSMRYVYDLDGNATDDTNGVNYANASSASTATVPANLTSDGPATRLVRVKVIDKDNGQNVYTATITVNNVAPTGQLPNVSVNEGQTATVGLTNVADPGDLATVRYVYDLDNNGTDDTAGVTYANASTATTANVPANLTSDGPATRTARVRVIDKDGASNVYTGTVTVDNVKPTAQLANSDVDEGSTATVGLTSVADAGDLASLRYVYDLDDNGTDDTAGVLYANASGATTATLPANLTADGPATRTARIRVIDKDGDSNVYTSTVTVRNVAPSFTPAATTPVDEGKVATVSVAGVTDPSAADGAAGTKYAYDFDNDGTYDLGGTTYVTAVAQTSADLPAALTADGPGTHRVRIAVIDKDGGLRSDTVDVVVDNVAPTATLANVTAAEGTTATVAFTGADDVSAADKAAGFDFEWDADGDGKFTAGTGSIAVPAPDGPATKTIKGAILDKDGGRREYTATLTVTNEAPTAKLTGPDAVPSSGETTIRIEIADAGADTLTSVLDWGDGTTQTIAGTDTKSADHKYSASGAKTITLVTTDSDGAKSAVATHTVTVAAVPAAPAPTPPPTVKPPALIKQAITGMKVTPRCLRADDLRAKIAKAQTMKVRFSLATAGPVKFTLQRLSGKGGATKCPPARGVKHPDGRRVPGVYRPFANKSVTVGKGANTVTVAATGRKGKRLAPGTYLLIVESGGVTARTKLWVLAD